MAPRLLAAHHENITIAISILAFAVSLFSLGWNVYRDVILKPRFRVRFAICRSWSPGAQAAYKYPIFDFDGC